MQRISVNQALGTNLKEQKISLHLRTYLQYAVLLALLTTVFSPYALGQGDGKGFEYSISRLQNKINNVLQPRFVNGMDFAVEVMSAETGEVLYTRDGTRPLIPASTMKLWTSATTLTKLGSRYKFKTMILADDLPDNDGTINGNVYIKGFGDPVFNSSDLDSLIQTLKDMGIKTISGNIVGDESFFDNFYERNEDAPEEPTGKLPPLSALTLDRNTVKVYVEPGRNKDGRVGLKIFPECFSYLKVVNKASKVTHRPRTKLAVTHLPQNGSIIVTVSGEMRVGTHPRMYNLRVHLPAVFAAACLKDGLEREGLRVAGRPKMGIAPTSARLITWHENPLNTVATQMNKLSDNFIAESMLKALGAELKEQPGSTAGGLTIVKRFLQEAGVDTSACQLADGSGLSRQNEISCEAMVKLLRYMYSNKHVFEDFYKSLSIAGVDGTLSGRMIGTEGEGNVHGKTGTLGGVSSLAGYTTSRDGELLVFAINTQNFYRSKRIYKSLQDQIVSSLASFSRNGPY